MTWYGEIKLLDRLGHEIKQNDFISYPNMNGASIKIAVVTKLTPKTFRYRDGSSKWDESIAHNPNQAIVITELLSNEKKNKLLVSFRMNQIELFEK